MRLSQLLILAVGGSFTVCPQTLQTQMESDDIAYWGRVHEPDSFVYNVHSIARCTVCCLRTRHGEFHQYALHDFPHVFEWPHDFHTVQKPEDDWQYVRTDHVVLSRHFCYVHGYWIQLACNSSKDGLHPMSHNNECKIRFFLNSH